jgi:pimeloyl-ACP methyl ester carboxylesterase
MNKIYLTTAITILSLLSVKAQINPINSPYSVDGNYTILSDSNMTDLNSPLLFFYPQTIGTYPVFMFQLGANGFGNSVINRHTYDLFMQNLASYGFVVIVIDDSQAGFPNGASFIETHDWFNDMVIDPSHWLNSYADPTKVVIGGHSNGGVNASALLVDRPSEIDGIVFMDSYPSGGVFGIGAHDVSGYTGKVLTMSANENDPTANKDGWDEFINSSCKTYVDITGLDHGGFGDYVLASQPVGSIGRVDATATIRHFLVGWMLSEFKGDAQASNQLMTSSLHPNTIQDFVNDCGSISTGIDTENGKVSISVFPNPATNSITITTDLNRLEVSIINSFGQIILRKTEIGSKLKVDLNHFAKGIYFVNVNGHIKKVFVK